MGGDETKQTKASASPEPPLSEAPDASIQRLADVVATLRSPVGGCPWDLAQTHESLRKYVIEEAYEVADAIDSGQPSALREELGDLLFQVVLHAQLASERDAFTLQDVIDGLTNKMIRRHPHVFSNDPSVAKDPQAVAQQWRAIKRAEGRKTLDGIPRSMPALPRAMEVGVRAAKVGFDWAEARDVLDKVEEEIGELREALDVMSADALEDELGDLLFALTSFARKLSLDPSAALRRTIEKFTRRFSFIEEQLIASARSPEQATLEQLESLWLEAKAQERPRRAKDDFAE